MKKKTLSTEFEDYFDLEGLKGAFKKGSGGASWEEHLPQIRKEIAKSLPVLIAHALADILSAYILTHFKSASEKGNTHVCSNCASTHH